MKRVIAILVLLCFSISIRAQTTPSVVTMQNAATATGNGTAIVVGVSAANPGANLGAVGVQIVGTFSATITFEATTDGTNWTPVMATNLEDDVRATTATAAGQYTILYGSAIRIRARISSYSSGSVTVKGRLIPGLTARLTLGGGGLGGGSGDVVGPASATDNAVARFNLTTGKLIQNSVVTIADSTGDMAGVGTVNTHTIPGGTDTFALLAASQSLTNKKLGSLTSNGLVTTSGGDGTLGVTVPGTGVLTALAVNVGSAGAPVLFDGAGGTPSSLTCTNCTGLPLSTGVTGDLPFANFVQAGSAGFVGATGAGDYSHRTPTQVTAALDAFAGDSGSGGTKGLVPAPTTGDATKYLKGDGTWGTVSASPGGSDTQLQRNNAGAFGGISGATSDGTNVTFGSGNLLATSPRITTGINDANGNESILLTATGSAVNEITIANAATGNAPTVSATGDDTNVGLTLSPKGTGIVDISTSARTGTAANVFRILTPADTALTASTQSVLNQFGGNTSGTTVTRQFATGALTTQRENVFVAPTYGFVGASTLTNAATVSITGAPAAGTNATITNSYALRAEAGNVRFDGGFIYFSALTSSGGGVREHTTITGSGGIAAFRGDSSVTSGIVVGSGFYANQFNNNNSTMVISVDRTLGITLASNLQMGWQSATSGAHNAAKDTGLERLAAAHIRVTNGSTGAGSLVLGTSTVGSIGTSGVGVLAIANGTAPTSSPADEFQLYSADSTAGTANAYIRNEAGEINRISGLSAINTSAFSKTSDTTLANITGLTRNVEAGRTYAFRAEIDTTANVAGGVKFAVSGTATATSINYSGVLFDGTAIVANDRATALDTTVCAATTSTVGTCVIKGTIVVNAAGTLTIQFAQNTSNGGASTVLVNQSLQLIPIS